MPRGPQRLSKKVAKKPVIHPYGRLASGTGILGDKRPVTATTNLQRLQWNMTNRQTKNDWTEED